MYNLNGRVKYLIWWVVFSQNQNCFLLTSGLHRWVRWIQLAKWGVATENVTGFTALAILTVFKMNILNVLKLKRIRNRGEKKRREKKGEKSTRESGEKGEIERLAQWTSSQSTLCSIKLPTWLYNCYITSQRPGYNKSAYNSTIPFSQIGYMKILSSFPLRAGDTPIKILKILSFFRHLCTLVLPDLEPQ